MNTPVRRTCTELGDDVPGGALGLPPADGRPLGEFRSTPAYVLLGDPGAGKTTEFDRESRETTELGDAALMLSAKDFIELDLDSHPEWRDRILFIDGLDEMRAGRDDSRVPLGEIRNRLDRLRPPGFRISCREADWLGHSDRRSLEAVSPGSRIAVLRLDELDDRQVTELLLREHERTDPQEFIDRARQHGVGGLLVNPLTLRLLVDAVRHGGDWPDSRRRTLEMACRQIAAEHNQEHRVATRPPPLETFVDAAGWLCALQLLSGIEGYVPPSGVTAHSFVSLTELGEPPASLSRSDLEHALTTKLFRATGDGFVPLHRHVAEFLAGRYLAKLIADGLPARRVVSLMKGTTDDRVVTSLRALSAWLASDDRTRSLRRLRERLRGTPTLAAHLESFCEGDLQAASIDDKYRRERRERREKREEEQRQRSEDWATHRRERREKWEEEQRQRSEDWAIHLHEHQDELLDNRFSPQNLATLANVHFGLLAGVDRHQAPRDRISDFIGGDPSLVDAVMIALRDAVLRDDLPEVDQTVSWSLESRHSWLARPVLVSLDMLDRDAPDRLGALPTAQKRKALAIYYCVPHGTSTPRWHDRWLRDDPDLVLGVLYQCAVADVRAGENIPSGLNELDGAEGHHDQVHDLRLRLLEAFPTRSSNEQLSLLDRLLTRALDHPDHAALLALAERKQASTSMPIGQRVRWWATGALIVQGSRLQQLKTDLADSEVRVRHLAAFLRAVWDRHDRRSSILADIEDPAALKELIEILGRWYAAPQYDSGAFTLEAVIVTLEMEMSDLVARLIDQLGSEPGDKVQQALTDLLEDPALDGWHPHLRQALEEHRVIHRDASYSHPSIEQVQGTLNDGPPANAAHLAALLEDRLADMCEDLRGSNSDFWRQFWNEDRHRRVTGAKHEDSCRDALLTNLQFRLPDDVDAVRQGSYAADTRSDIRANCRDFNVPIEIKKDSHPDVWKAMHDQLMALYTTDPATDGYGIYLVLWFADSDKPATRDPDGNRPNTPEELQRRLEQRLTAAEARKIVVIVMDVTKPGRKIDR